MPPFWQDPAAAIRARLQQRRHGKAQADYRRRLAVHALGRDCSPSERDAVAALVHQAGDAVVLLSPDQARDLCQLLHRLVGLRRLLLPHLPPAPEPAPERAAQRPRKRGKKPRK